MTADEFIEEAITVGLGLLIFLPTAALSGHMIAHHVSRNIDRFRELTPRRTFRFGIYCALSVFMSFGLVSLPFFLVLALTETYF